MIPFTKMHGLGNDFVILDNRTGSLPALNWAAIADRHFGIGCDQVVILEPSEKADIFMRIYNADGGEVESCGNASRCVAWLIAREKSPFPLPKGEKAKVTLETTAGVLDAWVGSRLQVTVDMGEPRLEWQDIPLAENSDTLHLKIEKESLRDPVAVSMGNPHMVFFVPDADGVDLEKIGPELEHHPLFPKRANIGVAQIGPSFDLSPHFGGGKAGTIKLRVWERGAGLTLACGTGACAAAVAACLRGLGERKAKVELPGGAMIIEWRADNHVLMTGSVESVFKGEFDPQPWRIRGEVRA